MNRKLLAISLWRILLVLNILSFSARGGNPPLPDSIARLQGQFLQIAIDSATGQIIELRDLASGQNFANTTIVNGGLWELEFAGNSIPKLTPSLARSCLVERIHGREPALCMIWSLFEPPYSPNLQVKVSVRLDHDHPSSRWGIEVDGLDGQILSRVRFPRVLNVTQLREERLLAPFWVGLLAEDPRLLFSTSSEGCVRREYDYPGHCSVQCLAFYQENGPGLYLSCDDTAGYRKLFAAFSECGSGMNFEMVHLPEVETVREGRYVLPYDAIVRSFQGDWYDAAAIYRAWATNQAWAIQSRYQRGLVPDWISRTGLWIWNRGHSAGVLDAAMVMRQALGLPVSVFWHWWHGCAYDTGFPEYLPPREGHASFAAALARAHAQHVRGLVYMNQRLWGMTTASWTNENAAYYAVKAADGAVKPEVYNQFTKLPCATMCMGTDFWRSKYAGLAEAVLNQLGVDGIYMDQACSSLACFDPHHGHPLGGGAYWVNGFRQLAAEIRRRSAFPGRVALAGEGCAENWLPHLDLMLALDLSRERYAAPDGWEAIPFFHAIYHGYGIFYGNYSSLTLPPYDDLWPPEFAPNEPLRLLDRKFSRQFYLEQARSLIWGQQPTLANFQPSHLKDRPDEVAFVIRIARLRQRALQYLQDGVMLAPPSVQTQDMTIPISRLSIYAGQREALKEYQKNVPQVLASAWRAADGTVGIAVVNITDQSISPSIILDPVKHGLPTGGSIDALDEAEAAIPGTFQGNRWIFQPCLPPLQAKLFKVQAR